MRLSRAYVVALAYCDIKGEAEYVGVVTNGLVVDPAITLTNGNADELYEKTFVEKSAMGLITIKPLPSTNVVTGTYIFVLI